MPKPSDEEPKMTKAQRKALEAQRLAEEAAAAAEVERIRLEEEERKRLEEEARLAEEKRLREAAEAARLAVERKSDEAYFLRQARELSELNEKVQKQREWEEYLQATPLPDPQNEAALNTYLSLRKEPEDFSNPPKVLPGVMQACDESEAVVGATDKVMGAACEVVNAEKIEWCKEFACVLRGFTITKLDELSSEFLSRAEEYEDDNKTATFASAKQELQLGLWLHTSSKHSRVKAIQLDECKTTIELPVALQKTRTAFRCLQTTYDNVSLKNLPLARIPEPPPPKEEEEKKKKKKKKKKKANKIEYVKYLGPKTISVGGLLNIEQLAVPTKPKAARDWTMREVVQGTTAVELVPYPAGQQDTSQAPLRIQYTVPSFVYVHHDKPTFGWWDEKRNQWEQEGVKCTEFSHETHVAKIELALLRPVAIVQPRAVDFPYVGWGLMPTADGAVQLTLKGSRFDVKLEMRGGTARVLEPQAPALVAAGLGPNSTPLQPGQLLLRLAKSGINLMPTNDDANFCKKPIKQLELEAWLAQQVSLVACVLEVNGSNWCSSRGPAKAMLNIRVSQAGFAVDMRNPPDEADLPSTKDVEEVAKPEPEPEKKEPKEGEEDTYADLLDDPDDPPEDKEEEPLPQGPIAGDAIVVVEPAAQDAVDEAAWRSVLAFLDKFGLTQPASEATGPTEELLAGTCSRSTLRRLAMDFYKTSAKTNLQEAFGCCDRDCLELQQTIHSVLNVVRVFTFH